MERKDLGERLSTGGGFHKRRQEGRNDGDEKNISKLARPSVVPTCATAASECGDQRLFPTKN